MARLVRIGTNITEHGTQSFPPCHGRAWPGHPRLAVLEQGEVVDGRHRHALGRAAGTARGAGHDTGVTSPAMSAPVRLIRAIAIRTCRDRWPGRAGIGVKPSFRLANTTNH